MPNNSSSLAKVPGTGVPSSALWRLVRDVVNPSAPAAIALLHQRGHPRDVVGGRGLVARAALAHHVGAHRAVRDLRADVHHVRHRRDEVEVLGERLPAPAHALGERGAGDVLDALHERDEPLALVGVHGREADAAVAHDDRRDAVPRRRREVRVPGDLAVVVAVDVDEAGRDDEAVGVERLRCRRSQRAGLAHAGDAAAGDGDVTGEGLAAAAVDDRPVRDQQVVRRVVHRVSVEARGRGPLRLASSSSELPITRMADHPNWWMRPGSRGVTMRPAWSARRTRTSEDAMLAVSWFGWILIGFGALMIWIALAFWPARVAERKGHSFFAFFVFSVFLFPVALIAAYAGSGPTHRQRRVVTHGSGADPGCPRRSAVTVRS